MKKIYAITITHAYIPITIVFAIIILFFKDDPRILFQALVAGTALFVALGMLHHHHHKSLNVEIIIEYILIAILVLIVLQVQLPNN